MGWIEGRRRWVWLAGLIFGALLLTPVGVSDAVPAGSGDDILVFVAHPDDDILIAAGVIKEHVDAGGSVTVAFLTNGDRCETPGQCSELDPDIGTVRQGEAVAAQSILGVAESEITFLGYPNGFVDRVRYGSPPLPAELAHTETYASRGMGSTDWHDHRMGAGSQHAAYTGANMLDDVEALLDTSWLATHRPEHIFTHSPWDRHPDHRVTYLTLINAVDRVRAIDPSYQPYIHTTIVHVKDQDQWGLWPATHDPSTPVNEYSDLGADSGGELVWDQRESFEVPASMQNPYFPTSGNPKAAAIEAHASQVAEDNYFIRRFVHKDEVFWVEKLGAAEGRPDAHSVDEGGTLSVASSGVLSNDVRGLGDPPNPPFDPTYLGPMTAVKVTNPAHGTVTVNADGSFTYTHDGSEGPTDSFTYRPVQGSTTGSIATVTININPVNDAPTAFADGPYTVTKGKSSTIPASGVLGNDTDPDNDPLTAVKDSDPNHGTLNLNGDGSFTYTHLGGTATTDSFTYHVRDPGGLTSAPVTVSLQINPVELPVMTDIADSVFKDDILWLVEKGITKGCNPPQNDRFCPDAAVTRGQMAAFMVRFLGLTSSDASIVFGDTIGTVFEEDIRKLATAGITRGCNPPANTQFCPNATVTRGQMAAFLVRALGLKDDGGGDLFTDDDTSVFESDIDRLATAGVTKGCNADGTHFCPNGSVTRGQMAAFLHRAAGLLPQG